MDGAPFRAVRSVLCRHSALFLCTPVDSGEAFRWSEINLQQSQRCGTILDSLVSPPHAACNLTGLGGSLPPFF
jgi:hypothetical protein